MARRRMKLLLHDECVHPVCVYIYEEEEEEALRAYSTRGLRTRLAIESRRF